MAQSGGHLAHEALQARPDLVHPPSLGHARHGGIEPLRERLSRHERVDRIGIPAPSGRRVHLGAGHPRTERGTERERPGGESGPGGACLLSGVLSRDQPGGTARRRARHHRVFQYGVLCAPQAQEPVAARLSPEQGSPHRRHEPGAQEDPGGELELFPAHCRQHGRGHERGQGAACHEDLWRRLEDPRGQGRGDSGPRKAHPGYPGPRDLPRHRPAQPEFRG